MATPRRPFAKRPLGSIEEALAKGASPHAVFLRERLATHREKGSIPGLLLKGPAGLEESLVGEKAGAIRKSLGQLEQLAMVIMDLKSCPPLVYVCGAIEADPPTTENSIRGMAAQVQRLPRSHVTDVVKRSVADSLGDSAWQRLWHQLTLHPEPSPEPGFGPSPEPGSGLSPEPGPLRRSVDPTVQRSNDPKTNDPTTAPILRSREENEAGVADYHKTHQADLIPYDGKTLTKTNGNGLDERFETFWVAYPKKVAKKAALAAWRKLRPDASLTERIIAALAWQRSQDAWLRDAGKFIPNPTTWLNQERWQDEPCTTPRLSERTLAIGRAAQEFLDD